MEIDGLESEHFCVKWSNHHFALVSVLESLFNDESYVDCTLSAEGHEISAHKVIVSACSPLLNKLLKRHYDKHPIILLRDVTFNELQAIIEYIYKGEVNLPHNQLESFLKAAESLQITGLSAKDDSSKMIVTDVRADTDSDSNSPFPKRGKFQREEEEDEEEEAVEYLTDEETAELGQVKIKKEDGETYQVYLVDNDTGTLKEVNAIGGAGLDESGNVAMLMDDLFEEDKSAMVKTPGRTKILTEKIQSVTNRPRMKPKGVIQRDDFNITCRSCGGLYKHKVSYINHLRHDCNQVHTCDACKKRFKNKRHLLDHVRDDCGRVHVCPRCNKYFKQKVNLTTHMKHYCKPDKQSLSPLQADPPPQQLL